jgi:hypothetical protein
MLFTWWSGGLMDIVSEWGIEAEHTRGSGPHYAFIYPHTGIVGRHLIPSRSVFSVFMAAFHIS